MRPLILAASMLVSAGAAQAEQLVARESRFGVKETTDRLSAEIEKRGMKVAARIDHAAGAKAVGMELPPTEVVMFGNPKLGTPLMMSAPSIGIDLPMRIIAWQDKAGKVWVGYTAVDALKGRHGITDRDEIFETMGAALDSLAKTAGGQ